MKTTEEKNRMIAEFMGYKQVPCRNGFAWDLGISVPSSKHPLPIQGRLVADDLEFHTSWEWLMEVVERIRRIPSYDRDKFSTYIKICDDGTEIISGSYGNEKGHNNEFFKRKVVSNNSYDIKANTYQAVVQFIEWYNENK